MRQIPTVPQKAFAVSASTRETTGKRAATVPKTADAGAFLAATKAAQNAGGQLGRQPTEAEREDNTADFCPPQPTRARTTPSPTARPVPRTATERPSAKRQPAPETARTTTPTTARVGRPARPAATRASAPKQVATSQQRLPATRSTRQAAATTPSDF